MAASFFEKLKNRQSFVTYTFKEIDKYVEREKWFYKVIFYCIMDTLHWNFDFDCIKHFKWNKLLQMLTNFLESSLLFLLINQYYRDLFSFGFFYSCYPQKTYTIGWQNRFLAKRQYLPWLNINVSPCYSWEISTKYLHVTRFCDSIECRD